MGHDPTKQLLGVTQSSDKAGTTTYASDPALFPAGTAVRLGPDGLLTVTKGSNQWVGISLGKSLSDSKTTTVLRGGSQVPIRLADDGNNYAYVVQGAPVEIDDATGLATVAGGSATTSNAVFVSGVLSGITEEGTTVPVALVDMVGGL